MVFIARAAEPMLPGCWVPTRTMRRRWAAAGDKFMELDSALMARNGKLRAPAVTSSRHAGTLFHLRQSILPASPERGPSPMQKPAVTLMVKAARAAGNVLLRY